MLPTDHARFCQIVSEALRGYSKRPTEADLEDWWMKCKGLTLEALEAGLKAHEDDPKDGAHPPKPVDITRRQKSGARSAEKCSASDPSGHCAYPGIFSDGTQGDGPWYCPLHRMERIGPEASRRITYSLETPWEDFRARLIAKRDGESQRSAIVRIIAMDIAKRHGNRPWQAKPMEVPPELERVA